MAADCSTAVSISPARVYGVWERQHLNDPNGELFTIPFDTENTTTTVGANLLAPYFANEWNTVAVRRARVRPLPERRPDGDAERAAGAGAPQRQPGAAGRSGILRRAHFGGAGESTTRIPTDNISCLQFCRRECRPGRARRRGATCGAPRSAHPRCGRSSVPSRPTSAAIIARRISASSSAREASCTAIPICSRNGAQQ